jgi:hypothetical protein
METNPKGDSDPTTPQIQGHSGETDITHSDPEIPDATQSGAIAADGIATVTRGRRFRRGGASDPVTNALYRTAF